MNKLMIAISAGEWEGIQHRPHHFMRRSATTGWSVLYLEPPASIIAPLKNRKTLTRWRNWLQGVRELEKDIYVIAPPPILPFGNKYRVVNKINQWLIAKTIKKAIKRFKGYQIDIYTFLPNSIDLLPFIKYEKLIYDCVDDHASFSGLISHDVVNQMEKELMNKANVTLATAKQLMKEREGWNNNFHLVPNGAEYELFANTNNLAPVPDELKEIKQPIVGFYGGISDWIDIPLLTSVAEEMIDVSFVFIGPVATNVEELSKLANVKFLGSKPYQQLPSYLHRFDVCLIPFKINKLTESVNPIKMFEYLSAGKPVVSTPLPEVLNYKEVIEIVENKEQMIKALYKTIENGKDSDRDIARRKQVGKDNSWDFRWAQVVTLIDKVKEKQ